MFLRSCLFASIGLFVSTAASLKAGPFVVGGFDAARGGFESLAPGEDSALAGDISTAFAGTTFDFTNTLTTSFLNGVNVAILGVATSDSSAITPLTASEQAALLNFVLGGGTALIFADNSEFDANAAAANASLLAPFGVSVTGTLIGPVSAPILNPTGPLTGPFTPVTMFATNFPGYFNGTGGASVLADLNSDPSEPAVLRFAPGQLGPDSGAVVFFSDSDAMVAGDSLSATNLNLVLNAFAMINTSDPAATPESAIPEPSTLPLVGLALGGLAAIRRRLA
jgi:hypothetical protein